MAFDTTADAVATGIPEEIDGVSLELEHMNVIERMTVLVMDRGVRVTREGAIKSAIRTFKMMYDADSGVWRERDAVELTGPDRVVVRREQRALTDE